ncbi:hypothetical protein [Halarchaeum sp. P4]|uniref:sialidase family protein n=1 Tax=Halarchaeum sp. P4 TaxID=3421639 RepID=UPI003EBA41F6
MSAMWNVGNDEVDREFQKARTPFSEDLYGVVSTKKGPYAIGAGGIIAADRSDSDEGWEVMIDDGPHTKDNRLNGLAVTDDGKRIWFAGGSGALGCYDVIERRKYDYSHPNQKTSTWEGIAVCGKAGQEKALVANGSGEVLPFMIDGFDADWGQVRKPVSGKASNIAALAASPEGIGYAVDTSGNAFKTTDDDGWRDIGIVNAQVKFHDIYAGKNQRVYVAAGDGKLYRYDDSYNDWTPLGVANEPLNAIDIYKRQDGKRVMVVMGGSGAIYHRLGDNRWEKVYSPTEKSLNDIALGTPDVAVGDSSIVLVRPRKHARTSDEVTSKDGDQYEGRGENFDHSDKQSSQQQSSGSSSGSTSTNNETSN